MAIGCRNTAAADRVGLILLCSIGASVSGAAQPGGVRVESSAPCVDGKALAARLVRALKSPHESRTVDLSVLAVASPADAGARLVLTATTRDGQRVLDRQYVLSGADCPSASELLSTVLERSLETLSLDRWTVASAQAAPPIAAANASPVGLGLRAAVHLETFPGGADADLGALVDAALGTQRLSFGLLGRASWPAALGRGRVFQLWIAACLGWRWLGERLSAGAELRLGQLWVFGQGFAQNRQDWLPWLELAPLVGLRVGPLWVGVEVAVSPIANKVAVENSNQQRAISPLRLGGWLWVPLR